MRKSPVFLIFALGIPVGWVIRDNYPAKPDAAVVQTPDTKSARSRHVVSTKSPDDANWSVFGKRAKDLNIQEREKAVKELDPEDRLAALEALASQAGLNGLSYGVKSMMEKILESWTVENFADAWTAARSTKNPDLADFMRRIVLAQLAKTDPDRAFALHLEQKAVDPHFSSMAPHKFLSSKLAISATAYIDALRQLPFGDNSTTFSDGKFAENFDFQTAADGLVKLMGEQKNKRPSSFPANFFSEWSKEDPEGAFAWWAVNPPLPFGGLGDMLRAMDRLQPDTSSGWLAARLQDPAMPRERIIHTIVNSDVYFANQIHMIARAMRDDATADTFLMEALAKNTTRRPLEQYANAINALSSPGARLQAFQTMKTTHRQLDFTEISDAQFEAWGITRQQAEQAFAK